MSRFSNRTARVVGYAAFAAVGGFAYISYQPAQQPPTAPPPRLIPLPELVSTAPYATELSTMSTYPRIGDPLVNLAPLPHPAWRLDRSMAELRQLELDRVDSLPRDYPTPQIRPMSAVRTETQERERPEPQLIEAAPEPQSLASVQWNRSRNDFSSIGHRDMVPLSRRPTSANPPREAAATLTGPIATDSQMDWSSRGMVLLRNAGQSLLERTVASPEPPVADQPSPSLAGYSVAKPVLEPPSPSPAKRTQHFIDQPQSSW